MKLQQFSKIEFSEKVYKSDVVKQEGTDIIIGSQPGIKYFRWKYPKQNAYETFIVNVEGRRAWGKGKRGFKAKNYLRGIWTLGELGAIRSSGIETKNFEICSQGGVWYSIMSSWKNLNNYKPKKLNVNFVEFALYFFTFWLVRKSLKVYSTRIVFKWFHFFLHKCLFLVNFHKNGAVYRKQSTWL